MLRVNVKPELLRWARERAGLKIDDLRRKFSAVEAWEPGEAKPALKQLEAFARATSVPVGYLFLPEPPEERLPTPDLRTVWNKKVRRPSPDLLDTIYLMQRRQAWLREELIECEAEPLESVGSARLADDPRLLDGKCDASSASKPAGPPRSEHGRKRSASCDVPLSASASWPLSTASSKTTRIASSTSTNFAVLHSAVSTPP
jgi:transcriptional regulator with XRE-family HTH domain